MMQTVSVVIPVYNNQETIEETCVQILKEYAEHFREYLLEILCVNDGSKDGSWQVLQDLKRRYPTVMTLVNLSRNFGQYGALHAGFSRARGDAVICISADLQDPTSLIPQMVKHWAAGTEVVVCYREQRQDGTLRRIFSQAAYSVARQSYPDLPQGGFDYWLMSRRVCELMNSFKGRHNFIQGYLMALGFSKTFIPYVRRERPHGKSGYTLAKKFKIIIDFFVDSSYLPIRAMSLLGALITFCGFVYSLLILWAWMNGKTPFPGWAPLMIMVMVIGGMVMMMLGVIGEYIWRIYDNIKDFPVYIIDEAERADS
jgi:dolichol-phosphate mannosyltransferase